MQPLNLAALQLIGGRMMPDASDSLIVSRDAGCLIITINQPERRNALSQAMWRRLGDTLKQAAQEPDIRVVVLQGAGNTFCAGADISEFATVYATPESAAAASATIASALAALDALPLPSMAVIRGACMGGGCALALGCDLQLADPSARFGINPTALGLAYSFRDCQRLAMRIGVGRARQMLIGARRLDAETALAWGIISELAATEALDARLAHWVDALRRQAPLALAAVKANLQAIDQGTPAETPELQQLFDACLQSAEFQDRTSAFLRRNG